MPPRVLLPVPVVSERTTVSTLWLSPVMALPSALDVSVLVVVRLCDQEPEPSR
jgi:hypothetical protein